MDRRCANPLCPEAVPPGRADKLYCGPTCRAEASKVRALLDTSTSLGKAVRGALRPAHKPKTGRRPPTSYKVFEVEEQDDLNLELRLTGLVGAHSREEAVRRFGNDGGVYLPLPRASFKLYAPDGSPL